MVNQRTPDIHGSRVSDSKVSKQDNKKSSLPSFGKPKIPKGKRTPEYPEGNTGAYPTNKRGPNQDYIQRRNG